jgi:P-type Cu2+ transporter
MKTSIPALLNGSSVSNSEIPSVILTVSGMKCAGCVSAVEQTLGKQTGVLTASVNLVTEKATVTYQPQSISPEQLAIALTTKGFSSQVESSVSAAAEPESNAEAIQRLKQIGLASALVILSSIGSIGDWPPSHFWVQDVPWRSMGGRVGGAIVPV